MSGRIIGSRTVWSLGVDDEGHRTYKVIHRVETSSFNDGPQTVALTPGLPYVGSVWAFGNDLDIWAFCQPTKTVKPEITKERCRFWTVEQTFSTKPLKRCQDTEIEDPLLEPMKISGSFVSYTQEATKDKDGQRIINSAHEQITGSIVEFDASRATVVIEQNVVNLELALITEAKNKVNDDDLWGLESRHIKLSHVEWERKIYATCNYYYTRRFEFDVDFDDFDRETPDKGYMVLNGGWFGDAWVVWDIDGSPADPDRPDHFIHYTDRKGENSLVVLNGAGLPANTKVYDWDYEEGEEHEEGEKQKETGDPGKITIQHYEEFNFLLLGIPTSL